MKLIRLLPKSLISLWFYLRRRIYSKERSKIFLNWIFFNFLIGTREVIKKLSFFIIELFKICSQFWKKIWTFGMSLKSWLLLTKLTALAMSASFSLMLVPNLSKTISENLASHKTGMRMSTAVCFLRLLVKHCSEMTPKNKRFYTRISEAPYVFYTTMLIINNKFFV